MAGFNWTQCAGLASFGLATISYLHAARQSTASDELTRHWCLVLSVLYSTIFIDLIANTRYSLLKTIGIFAGIGSQYENRRSWQVILLIIMTTFMVWLMAKVTQIMKFCPWIGWALIIGICSAGLLFVEIISLHQLDAIIYAKIGPVMVIGWLWLVLGFTASAIASAAARPVP